MFAQRLVFAASWQSRQLEMGRSLLGRTASILMSWDHRNEENERRFFSTNVVRKLELPPNLKIDPRSISSPFYDAMQERKRQQKQKLQNQKEAEQKKEMDQKKVGLKDDVEEDEEEEEEMDDKIVGTIREPALAIPLPQRLNVPIYTLGDASEKVGTIFLSSSIFGLSPVRVDILHRVVIYQRNKKRGRRNGGARTKTISEVSGSGRKVRKQKGLGMARAGHSRPPHWRGGAKAHGPKGSIQNYETKLNKKVRVLGLKMALSQKLLENNLLLVDTLCIDTFKTKPLVKKLNSLAEIGGKDGISAFFLDHPLEEDENMYVSGVNANLRVAINNIPRVKVSNQRSANVYDILKHEKLVISLSALRALEERLGGTFD